MAVVKQPISVQDSNGKTLDASLVYNVPKDELEQVNQIWVPYMQHVEMEAHMREISIDVPDHVGWDWALKFDTADLGTAFIGIEYRDFMQGMLVLDTNGHACKDIENLGKEGIYISYVAVAPWNITRFMRVIDRRPILEGIGAILMRFSVLISRAAQHEGRLVLHSVPQAEVFYRNHCRMKDLGDEVYNSETLRRFEMTKDLADLYLAGGK